MIIVNGSGVQGGTLFPPPADGALVWEWAQANFTSSGTFVVPDNIVSDPVDNNCYVYLWMCGGGGGSGGTGSSSMPAGSGQGGDYVENYPVIVTEYIGQGISVTIGSGGGGVTSSNDSLNGSAGAGSSFGSFISVAGGTGGFGRSYHNEWLRGCGGCEFNGSQMVRSPNQLCLDHRDNVRNARYSCLHNGPALRYSGTPGQVYGAYAGAAGGNGCPNSGDTYGDTGPSWGGPAGVYRGYHQYGGYAYPEFASSGGAGLFGGSSNLSAPNGSGAGGSCEPFWGQSQGYGNGGSGRCLIKWQARV